METVKDPIVFDSSAREGSLEKRVNTVLLSVSTALILITVNFLWNLKGDFAAMQEREKARTETIDATRAAVNRLQLDIEDLKQRTTRIEVLQQQK
ncbi:hypothetical protein [Puia sp.]|jgi:cell division protein FtsB|uniref:hypothetical protein n=1 Tax=Puia sp. TaxID=2045100 RepID=UPI002F40351D